MVEYYGCGNQRCGLVRLKNEFTEWCVRHGCNNAEAPGYRAARKALTRGGDRDQHGRSV